MRTPITALCALLGLVAAAAPLAAQSEATLQRATVVRIEGEDVYLDAGAGALAGAQKLTVFRSVTVRHPVTRKALSDRFAIGELQIVQAGETLTLARAAAAPSHPIGVGDVVDVARAAEVTESGTGSGSGTEVRQAVPGTDLETAEMLRYFEVTLAQPIDYRIKVYDAYLGHYPKSRYRAFLEQELRYLRALQTAQRTQSAPDIKGAQEAALLAGAIEFLPPRRALEGAALELAAYVRSDAQVRSLIVHVRSPDAALYDSLPMELDGLGHARVRIGGAQVKAPGLLLFIEATDVQGKTAATFGSAKRPHAIEVVTRDGERARVAQGRMMRVRWSSELASFDGFSGRDYFFINEGDFLYRVRLGPLYGVRMGYGRYDGRGGTVEDLDELDLDPAAAGFTYAFLETEFQLTALLGVALRGTLGLGRPDPGREGEVTGGFQIRGRIGEAEGTHLVVGGELVPEIGQRALLALGFELIERLPMAAEVQVTDQPVNSDELAVRIVYDVGFRVSDRIAIALRPSYQLRTIRHAGPGLGLGATFDW